MSNVRKYFIGYLLGIIIFILAIPFGLYKLPCIDSLSLGSNIIMLDLIRKIISILFFVLGTYFMIWSNIFLLKKGKGGPTEGFGISVSPKTKILVVSGPYRYTRNPMVFGVFSLYFSIVIYLNSVFGFLIVCVFFVFAVFYLKQSEEKRLIKDFGEEYLNYKKKVSMIIPYRKLNLRNNF